MSGTGIPAVVFGRPSDLFESIVAEFRSNNIPVVFDGALLKTVDSILVVFDHSLIEELFGDDSARSKKLVRSWENQVSERVTTAAIDTDGRRLLVVCDVRRTDSSAKRRAIRGVRNLALRIRYECSVNGLEGFSATYAAVTDDTQLKRTARSVVQWHQGAARTGVPMTAGR